jgi:hypothetical protein
MWGSFGGVGGRFFSADFGYFVFGGRGVSPRKMAIRRAFITVRLGHVRKVRNDIAILLPTHLPVVTIREV